MASLTIERQFKGAGTYRLFWEKDGQNDKAEKPANSADELEAIFDRWQKMGYRITKIEKVG